jgi:hypothetical protein
MQFDNHLMLTATLTGQVVRIAVWTGLVAATVTLLVLMRTRWGQSQPLRKCIVLSTLVHLLFGIYTTTVNIVVASIGRGNSAPLWVALDGGESQDGSREGTEDEGDLTLGNGAPWNGLARDVPAIDEPLMAPPRLREDLLKDDVVRKLPEPRFSTDRNEARTTNSSAIEAPRATRDDAPRPGASESIAEARPDRYRPTSLNRSDVGPVDLPRSLLDSAADLVPPRFPRDEIAPQGPADGEKVAASTTGTAEGIPLKEIPGSSLAAPDGNASTADAGASANVPAVLKGRVGSDRLRRAIANGGSRDTEAAVVEALQWLADHQSKDGRWNPVEYEAGRSVIIEGQDHRGAGSQADTGITGLTLLAFLAHGNTHLKGEHPKTVELGLDYLRRIQAADGNLAGNATPIERMYCHAMATCALSEAYAMTRDEQLAAPVRRAIQYCVRAQDKRSGGWRYQPGDAGDTSQLGWQVMALKSAELAGIPIPSETRAGMIRFLESVASGRARGLASYRPGHRPSHAMTAEALVCRQFLGVSHDLTTAHEAGNFVLTELPGQRDDNVYYWYYGTLGMFQLQGEHWKRWNKSLQESLLHTQRGDGDARGSWDPDKVWGAYGGRVYSTALSTLCLEVYYRFLPLYVEAAGRERAVE